MCRIVQDLIDEEVYDAIVNEKTSTIRRLIKYYNFTFSDAFKAAGIEDDTFLAVVEALDLQLT